MTPRLLFAGADPRRPSQVMLASLLAAMLILTPRVVREPVLTCGQGYHLTFLHNSRLGLRGVCVCNSNSECDYFQVLQLCFLQIISRHVHFIDPPTHVHTYTQNLESQLPDLLNQAFLKSKRGNFSENLTLGLTLKEVAQLPS